MEISFKVFNGLVLKKKVQFIKFVVYVISIKEKHKVQ